jgi:copper(I)-binding protein
MKPMFSLMFGAALLAAAPAWSQVTVSQPWVRATVAQQKATGAFMTLTSAKELRLVGASSPAAGAVEVHEMKMVDDVMRMRHVPALPLPAGQAVALTPGGYHLMLLDVKQQFKDGDKVPLTLEVEDAQKVRSKVEVVAIVRPLNSAAMQH